MENENKKIICSQCGASLKENAKFCPKCGKAVLEKELKNGTLNFSECDTKHVKDSIGSSECDAEVDDDESMVVEVNENVKEQQPPQKNIVDSRKLKEGLKNSKKIATELLFEDDPNDNEEVKKKKHKKEIRGIIIGLIVLVAISWIGNNLDIFSNSEVDNAVFQRFETYSPITYSEVSYVDAFSLYFDNIKWKTLKTDDGVDVVEFNGTCFINNQLANVCMQFSLDNGSCQVSYIDVDGEPGDLFDISKIIKAVFANAYQEKELSLYNSNYDYSDLSDSENVTMADTYIADEALEESTTEANTLDRIDEEQGSPYLVMKDTFLWEDMNQKITVCKLAQGEELMITDYCGDGWLYGIYGDLSGFIPEEDIEILDDYTMYSMEDIEVGVSEKVEKALSGRYEVYFGGDGGAVLEITYLSDEDIYAVNFSGSMLDYAGETIGYLVAYSDGSDGIWEFYEDSAYEAGNYTPSMSLEYDGADSIVVTSLDGQTFGGANFPGFEGIYMRTEE